ncbi:MAG: hypothetical protein A2992_02155 [Elusimicrobia bacterium RIFCSPLOWO2_01_FULL_59_12]|nr:MAG: hypothetical protein A2992_02155 [Elusimicrobia bacterium RIFCSPLOWO2_01_FULL_59_12]
MVKIRLIAPLAFFSVGILIPLRSGAADPASAKKSAALVIAKKTTPVPATKPAPPAPQAAGAAEPPVPTPEYQRYAYQGDRYRDPFVPLAGEFRDQGTDRPPQISSLLLKGIIQDGKSRMALLTTGVSSYILRGGRLYDGRNHLMKGISGIVKSNSVVLMGSDRTVRELKVTTVL